jgi:hypothetical protein
MTKCHNEHAATCPNTQRTPEGDGFRLRCVVCLQDEFIEGRYYRLVRRLAADGEQGVEK